MTHQTIRGDASGSVHVRRDTRTWSGPVLAVALVSALLAGCAGSQTTDPIEEAAEPSRAAPPIASSPTRSAAFDAEGNPYAPGTTDLLARTFYFQYDRSELTPDALRTLQAHAQTLSENPERTVTIEGHADERGSRDYNLALGEQRAQAVRLFLVSTGVPSRQIVTVSYGEERPDDVRHDEAGWSRNRRAFMGYRQTGSSLAYSPSTSTSR